MPEAPPNKNPVEPARRREDCSVLVVDDELDVAVYLASVLEDAGMKVSIAHDGFEALEAIKREIPDLISLDLVMPRHSGIKVLAELRRHREWSRIPVVVVTAHAHDREVRADMDSVLAEATMAGPSLYLEKPVTPASYLQAICKVLRVTPPEAGTVDSAEELRREALALVENASEGSLRDLVGRLKDRRSL